MKTTVETLEFPCEFKKKLKMKVSLGNLSISFISGHLIKINNTNLSVIEPYKIIVENNSKTLIAYLYEDNDKIYLPISNAIILFTKFITILNEMNKWEELHSIGLVKKTITKNGKNIIENRYYISSLFIDIIDFSNAIRNHWSVENKLHWHLDFTFKEDKNTTKNKNALLNLQIVNKFVLGILNQVKSFYTKLSLKKIRKLISFDFETNFVTLLCYLILS